MPTFPTPGPVALRIRNGAGRVDVQPVDGLGETTIELTALNDAGARAIESATITHHGDTIVVELPERASLLGRNPAVAVEARLPAASTLEVAVGSADITVGDGLLAVTANSGSGDIRIGATGGDVEARAGSGDITIGHVGGALRATAGSGDVQVASIEHRAAVSTGSGDVRVDTAHGSITTKTGSGDVAVGELVGELESKSGSGGTRIDRAASGSIRVRTASGDVAVGVATGTAAWLDLNSVSGRIVQELDERAAPTGDQPRLALTLTTVSGDIVIRRS